MITTIDGGDFWSWSDAHTLWKEDGTKRPLLCSDIVFTAGKYKDSRLDEISDSWYLKFIKEKNSDDYFIKTVFEMRLKELE